MCTCKVTRAQPICRRTIPPIRSQRRAKTRSLARKHSTRAPTAAQTPSPRLDQSGRKKRHHACRSHLHAAIAVPHSYAHACAHAHAAQRRNANRRARKEGGDAEDNQDDADVIAGAAGALAEVALDPAPAPAADGPKEILSKKVGAKGVEGVVRVLRGGGGVDPK
jgi:hypothetical protein